MDLTRWSLLCVVLMAIMPAVGCAEFRGALLGASESALQTTEVIGAAGQEMAQAAAESAETPIGMVGGWAAWLLFGGMSSGAAWLLKRLRATRGALQVVTNAVEIEGAAAVKKRVQARLSAEAPQAVKLEMTRALRAA